MINEILNYYINNSEAIIDAIIKHFLMTTYGVLFALAIAIPLGFLISDKKHLSNLFIKLANILQTIPALALLSLLIIVVGMGPTTVVIAIFTYALLPILSATVSAIEAIPVNLIDAAKGMGMSKFQIIIKIKLPLSLPLIIGGVRNAYVLAIGVAAVGTFIGAGGLGDVISRGLNVSNGSAIIWAGAIPIALMAVMADFLLSFIEKKLVK